MSFHIENRQTLAVFASICTLDPSYCAPFGWGRLSARLSACVPTFSRYTGRKAGPVWQDSRSFAPSATLDLFDSSCPRRRLDLAFKDQFSVPLPHAVGEHLLVNVRSLKIGMHRLTPQSRFRAIRLSLDCGVTRTAPPTHSNSEGAFANHRVTHRSLTVAALPGAVVSTSVTPERSFSNGRLARRSSDCQAYLPAAPRRTCSAASRSLPCLW